MATPHIPLKSIMEVFDAWRKTRPRPDRCRFTRDRQDLIRYRLRQGYTPADLILLIEYINKADDDDCRWMRGHNPRRREYLDLANMLKRERLAGRVEAAEEWRDKNNGKDGNVDADPWRIV